MYNNLQDQEQKQAAKKAKSKMNSMKYEIASELGVNLKEGYNGDLTSREAGYVGGEMVRRMIKEQQESMK